MDKRVEELLQKVEVARNEYARCGAWDAETVLGALKLKEFSRLLSLLDVARSERDALRHRWSIEVWDVEIMFWQKLVEGVGGGVGVVSYPAYELVLENGYRFERSAVK